MRSRAGGQQGDGDGGDGDGGIGGGGGSGGDRAGDCSLRVILIKAIEDPIAKYELARGGGRRRRRGRAQG